MSNFIQIPNGNVVDIDSLQDLYKDGDQWKSSGEDCTWEWEDEDVEIIRKAMLAKKSGTLRGAFMCEHCGAPNVIERDERGER